MKEVTKVEKLASVTEQDTDSEMTTSTETDNTTGNDDDDSDDISGNVVRDMIMMLKLTCPALSPLRCPHRQISNIRSGCLIFTDINIIRKS